ncbi:hypothetical protein ACEPAF_88 [Sanghuangporus sanghuang]
MSTSPTRPRLRANASPLHTGEIVWRDRYTMLESHGYRLRQRYKPEWVRSWLATKKPLFLHEDFHFRTNCSVMDAVKISDGRRVVLKRVRSNSGELDIHRFLSEPQRLEHPRNHAAPLLDEFADTEDPNFTYIVLPLLLYYYRPDFYFVDEVVDFFRQLLEGVQYMHEVGVAHRDCSILNIMMDAGPLYPKGFHPVASILDASGTKRAHRKRRRDVGGVRYYFIDFGISSKFEPGEERKVIGIYGQDDEVPELSISVPYDPFLTDVFIIGNLIRKEFLEKYSNLNFLAPLIERMTEPDPKDRCTSSEAQTIFNRLISEQQRLTLRWRLKEKDSGPVTQFFQDAGTICRESLNIAKGSLATASQNTGRALRKPMTPASVYFKNKYIR